MSPFAFDFLRAILALAFTLGLIIVVSALVRRYGLGFKSATTGVKNLKLVEKLPLNASTTLYVVEHENQRHLIASTSSQTTLLHSQPKKKK